MTHQEITVEKLLKELNKALHSFFIKILIHTPQIAPPSLRKPVEQWLSSKPFLNVNEDSLSEVKQEDDRENNDFLDSHYISNDTQALFHFYQTTEDTYQPKRQLLHLNPANENKEEIALFHAIQTYHLNFEMAHLLFLLIQHGQTLWMIHDGYGYLKSESYTNPALFTADVLWYRSAAWITIHSIALAYAIKILFGRKNNIREEKNIPAKLNSYLLSHFFEVKKSQARDNIKLISILTELVKPKKNIIHRDFLSWIDDIHNLITTQKKSRSELLFNQLYELTQTIQTQLQFFISSYFAEIIVKAGIISILMTTILSFGNYISDLQATSSSPLGYGFFPWLFHLYNLSPSLDASNKHWIAPLLYYFELKLWTWLLIPIVSGIIEISIIQKWMGHDFFHNKGNFRKNTLDTINQIRDHYFLIFKTQERDYSMTPAEQTRKMSLIENIAFLIQRDIKKPFFNLRVSQQILHLMHFLQFGLHQTTHIACKFLALMYSVATAITFSLIFFILENLPAKHCLRLNNAISLWKRNHLEQSNQPRVSHVSASLFSSNANAKRKTIRTYETCPPVRPKMYF